MGACPYTPGLHHFDSSEIFFSEIARGLPSCFRRLRIWKQEILPAEIHESLQSDDGAAKEIRIPAPQIRRLVFVVVSQAFRSQKEQGEPSPRCHGRGPRVQPSIKVKNGFLVLDIFQAPLRARNGPRLSLLPGGSPPCPTGHRV